MPKDSFIQLAEELLKLLEGQKGIIDFLEPVNWKKLGLFEYPKIIKTPMSVQTIRQNLKNSKYSNLNQVIRDINLIWSNCRTFNEEKSPIVKNADKLDLFCKSFFNQKIDLPKKRGKPELEEEENSSESENDKIVPKVEEEKLVFKEINYKDLVTLKEKVMEANLQTLSKILALVKKRCGNNILHEGDNVVIALENLTYQTFKEIWELANATPETNEELLD